MSIRSLAVFCGSQNGKESLYAQHAAALGKLLAEHKVTVIFGGGSQGLMGTIADHCMKNDGKVVGIIPKMLVEWERQHQHISELIVTDDMHIRKRTIYNMCDAAMILPGGFGTLDELFEILTWNQLSIHDKKIFILNSGGFYDHLIQHIQHVQEQQFLYEKAEKRFHVLDDPSQLIQYLS
ncbi:MAG: TIGR00730 family Rossman fold protein [Bacteroidota bacterium]